MQEALRGAARHRPSGPLLGSWRPQRGLAGAPEGMSRTRNPPRAARAWRAPRSRRRKWLRAPTGRGGAKAVSHSTLSGLQPRFVLFFTGCSAGKPAAEISPLAWVAEPPRVRASRVCPPRPLAPEVRRCSPRPPRAPPRRARVARQVARGSERPGRALGSGGGGGGGGQPPECPAGRAPRCSV